MEDRWRDRRSGGYYRNYELSPIGAYPPGRSSFGSASIEGCELESYTRSSRAVTPVDKEDSPFNNGFREGSIIPRNRYSCCYRRKTIRVRENWRIDGFITTFQIYSIPLHLPYYSLLCSNFLFIYTTISWRYETNTTEWKWKILLTTITYHRWETFPRRRKKEFSRKLMPLLNDQV